MTYESLFPFCCGGPAGRPSLRDGGTGCDRSGGDAPPAEETVTVHLNLLGDFDVAVDQDPLTRSESSDDVYAINVIYDDGQYAYGLFDNVADMVITLLSNHRYTFECSLIKNAKNTIFYGQAFNNAYSGYAYPFQTSASNSTLVNNRFILGTGVKFTGLQSSNTHMASTSSPSTSNYSKYAPGVNRFYGRTANYNPVPNGTIDIYLKRVVFGTKFVISGLQEGYLTIKAGDIFTSTYLSDGVIERIYTCPDVYNAWNQDLPLVYTVELTYTSDRGEGSGTLWNLSQSRDIQFRRNVMTTVNIQLAPDLSGIRVNLTEEEMDPDNDIHLGINTDGLIDIIVNPND